MLTKYLRKTMIVTGLSAAAILAATATLAVAQAAEHDDRNVDAAALSAQDQAASELAVLLRKYKGTPREANLLYRYAEIQQQSADMDFRILHDDALRQNKKVDLSSYKKIIASSIPSLTRLIQEFPHFEALSHSYFMRARAYDESGDKARASQDYLHLVKSHPSSEDTIPAYMALAEISIAADHHAEAVSYLSHVTRLPGDSHYAVALYKMAWAQFNLKEIAACLATSEKLIAHLNATSSTDQAMLENVQKDIPRFYFAGFERKQGGYQTSAALAFFQKIAKQPMLGKMTVEYAYLLRTRDYEKDLMSWKDLVLAAYPDQPESHEVLLATFEYQLARGDYDAVAKSAQDIAKVSRKFKGTDAAAKAEKLLLDTSTALQRLMVENRDPARTEQLTQELATVYEAFTQIVADNDPRLKTIHGNLGETLFSIKQYTKATENYRWVVAHSSWSDKSGGISGGDASLKSISSRYEDLRANHLIPGELKAVAIPSSDGKISPEIREWIDWIDAHAKHSTVGLDNFQFEANRTLYSHGRVNEAVQRLREFALSNPKSSFAIPAATLVMDTYIASSGWEKLGTLASDFVRVKAWQGTPFAKHVYKVAADSKYKHAEALAAAKDYSGAMHEADEFEKLYPNSDHLLDALTLAGNSAVAAKNRKLAIHYFSRLAAAAPKSDTASKSLLAIAKIEEDRYAFSAAARAYLIYMGLPSKVTGLNAKKSEELRKRVLMLAWLGGDGNQLASLAGDKAFCGHQLRAECERYQTLRYLMASSVSPKTSQVAVKLASRASPALRPVWAAIALENGSKLSFLTRHKMVEELSSHWQSLDAMTKISLVPHISTSVPQSFAMDRSSIQNSGRLQATGSSITRRLKLIGEMENSATAAAKLPWMKIRTLVLNEMASAYSDLVYGLRTLPAPRRLSAQDSRAYAKMLEGMVAPFDQKSLAIRKEAFQLASQSAVEPAVYNAVADSLFNPSGLLAGTAGKSAVVPRQHAYGNLDLELIRSVDPQGEWKPVNYDTADASQILRARWAAAMETGNWPQVAYFASEARHQAALPAEALGAAKAVSLAYAGARAEGTMALSDLCHGSAHERLRAVCPANRNSL